MKINNFTPFYDKIVIVPFESNIVFTGGKLQEVGEVVAVGSKVKFAKVGDIIYFNKEGVRVTQKIKEDDVEYYTILECPEFINGIIAKVHGKTKKKSSVVK